MNILKSGVAAGTTFGSTWAAELADYKTIADSFLTSLQPYGAFDAIFTGGGFLKLPLKTNVIVVTSPAVGASVLDEAQPKPTSKLELANRELTEHKCACTVVVTDALAKSMSPAANDLIGNQLRAGIAKSTDEMFLNCLDSTGVESNASTGLTAAQFTADLDKALHAVNLGVNSKPYLVLPASVVKHLALVRDTGGALAFPQLLVNGGSIQGIRVVISDAASTSGVLLDSSQVAAASDTISLSTAEHASIALDDDPTSGPVQMTSLWQSNMKAIRAERYFGCELLRSDAAALITSLSTA